MSSLCAPKQSTLSRCRRSRRAQAGNMAADCPQFDLVPGTSTRCDSIGLNRHGLHSPRCQRLSVLSRSWPMTVEPSPPPSCSTAAGAHCSPCDLHGGRRTSCRAPAATGGHPPCSLKLFMVDEPVPSLDACLFSPSSWRCWLLEAEAGITYLVSPTTSRSVALVCCIKRSIPCCYRRIKASPRSPPHRGGHASGERQTSGRTGGVVTSKLEGRVALISGISTGLGRAGALLFAAEGASVVGLDIDADGAAVTVAEIIAGGGTGAVIHGDVSVCGRCATLGPVRSGLLRQVGSAVGERRHRHIQGRRRHDGIGSGIAS